MAVTASQSLAGTLLADDGSCTAGASAIYNASGGLPMLVPPSPATGGGAFGGGITHIPLTSGRNSDGSVLVAASQAAGAWLVANTIGTSLGLVSEGAKNNTKTDIVFYEMTVPAFYTAATNFNITINALFAANGGTVSVSTVKADLYLLANAGTSGATLIATSAATVLTTAADYAFVVTGATLTPGARIIIAVTGVITETANAGTNSKITINDIRAS